MARYKLHPGGVIDTENNCVIPRDLGNLQWIEYLTWLENNSPDPMFSEAELLTAFQIQMREELNARLKESNLAPDIWEDLSKAEQTLVKDYRKALDVLPVPADTTTGVVWPEKPTIIKDKELK